MRHENGPFPGRRGATRAEYLRALHFEHLTTYQQNQGPQKGLKSQKHPPHSTQTIVLRHFEGMSRLPSKIMVLKQIMVASPESSCPVKSLAKSSYFYLFSVPEIGHLLRDEFGCVCRRIWLSEFPREHVEAQ